MEINYIARFAQAPSPLDIDWYEANGGFRGLRNALDIAPKKVIETIKTAKLKGRGGAGFDTGLKWDSVNGDGERFLVCNADEGEPGTFKDKFIMEKTPYLVIEGMCIAAHAIGAERGFIYIRGEYPDVVEIVRGAIRKAEDKNFAGKKILGKNFNFHIEIKKGGGSYVVGDETALLNSIMGNRGYPLLKPPYPTEKGLWGKPTVINNVETLAYVPFILSEGPNVFSAIGSPDCPGPKLFSLSGHVNKPGIYELPMGVTVREAIDAAGGVKGYFKAVQIGGSAGPVFDYRCMDYPLSFGAMREKGGALGSGALVVMNSTVNMVQVFEVTMRFFSEESCGQCFPCRYGTRQLEYMADRIASGRGKLEYLPLIRDTVRIMYASSFCPFGQSVALPVNTILSQFGDEVESYIKQQHYLKEVV